MSDLVIVPTVFVHDDRYGAIRTGRRRLNVLHTTEGWEGVDRCEQLVAICKTPGDRVSSSGNRYGSSYHACFDTDCVRRIVPENRVSYSAPGANNDGIHAVFPARVSQTREQWLDDDSTGLAIWQCAMWLLHQETANGIPAVRLTDAEVLAGKSGYVDHWTISRCYHQTDHTDLGATFPWDVLAARIASLRAPTTHPEPPPPVTVPSNQEDDMKIAIFAPRDANARFVGTATAAGVALSVRWTGPGSPKVDAMLAAHKAAGATEIAIDAADLANTFLDGPLPTGDALHNWTIGDFANVSRSSS